MSLQAGLPHPSLPLSTLPSAHLNIVLYDPEQRTQLGAQTPNPRKLGDKGVLFQAAMLVVICYTTIQN